jgi:hypothetical protein
MVGIFSLNTEVTRLVLVVVFVFVLVLVLVLVLENSGFPPRTGGTKNSWRIGTLFLA